MARWRLVRRGITEWNRDNGVHGHGQTLPDAESPVQASRLWDRLTLEEVWARHADRLCRIMAGNDDFALSPVDVRPTCSVSAVFNDISYLRCRR